MDKYKFLKKGAFENLEKFEKKLNEMVATGWRVVNFTNDHGGYVVLLERIR
ncbi:MAG: hypothetical protein ACMVP2_05685 [Imperialibacter sp.]|uniref:hypothetical protein n=1 Tax=Imperialibacter sp. TaxID=2038411 RepID=UPI0030D7BD8C|tara:strand:- start:2323 stop:2475 length:153 start_codon:yes stop_codon:yes gene_type:complete